MAKKSPFREAVKPPLFVPVFRERLLGELCDGQPYGLDSGEVALRHEAFAASLTCEVCSLRECGRCYTYSAAPPLKDSCFLDISPSGYYILL